MTLADVSETYGIPLDALYGTVGAGIEIPPDTVLKDLEKLVPGAEVWALRGAVAAYLDGTWVPDESQRAPEEAAGPASATPTVPAEPTTAPVGQIVMRESNSDHVPQGPGLGEGLGSGDGTGLDLLLLEDGALSPALRSRVA
jgi:hypothetical protein